jgi:intracellular sulfur oxidation DsrE/DsrF family protein
MSASPSRRAAAKTLVLAAAGVAASTAAGTSNADPAHAKYKAVFQVSDADPAKWKLTLNNMRNAQAELGADNVTIELVAFGPGIGILKADAEVAPRVSEASQAGIAVLACENTIRGMQLTRAQLHPKAGSVPSGVAHLIRRQNEGYAYIRS